METKTEAPTRPPTLAEPERLAELISTFARGIEYIPNKDDIVLDYARSLFAIAAREGQTCEELVVVAARL